MSTTHKMFSATDVNEFVEMLKEWPNCEIGPSEAAYSVSPFLCFYFTYDEGRALDASLALVDTHEAFEKLAGHPFTVATHPASERPHPYGSKRLPNLREYAQKKFNPNDSLIFEVTDEKNHGTSPATAGYFWRMDAPTNRPNAENGRVNYSYAQFYYRWQWWQDNREAWRRFVLDTIERLRPAQVYSGFAMATPLVFGARAEVSVWERALTPRFYGLDINDTFTMSLGTFSNLSRGIRAPTWAFFLSDPWREKLALSRVQVREHLNHPQISVTECGNGLWIELGKQPELYPVEDGVPELPVLLNKLLKPIRSRNLNLGGLAQWDGDPNERFTKADAQRWMGRFDEDSDWPDPATRRSGPVSPPPAELPAWTHFTAGEVCPRAGWWVTDAQHSSRRYVEYGETFPEIYSATAQGQTLWQWDSEQRSPVAPVPEAAREAMSAQTAPRAGHWHAAGQPSVQFRAELGDVLPFYQNQVVHWHWVEHAPPGVRAVSGSPCPYPGIWTCEDYHTGEQTFMFGVPMPQIDGRNVTWRLIRTL